MQETWVQYLVERVPWRRGRQPIPVFLLGDFHGHRNLVGYSPCGHKHFNTTEQLTRRRQWHPHSSTLAWKIPWTEVPSRLQSMGSRRVRPGLSNFTFTFHFYALEKEMATHSSVLAWRIPGMGSQSQTRLK